ncbi:InlB B-repeat-containing protein [Ruminococcus sp. NSJ-71]|uniref:InlB B-repeat-containing protein n=1 Tax=Ruminococcus intestinalis TaxID=2763066 RepID=A0ABR7HK57_9FIRM|nr:InlB B-repeat-containing protein [Ruminococcus intestinalis]MBC5727826.1 InlB B-repeat-containing protein [Ruminococcus intestinalis]
MKKRILSILLTLCMTLCLTPISVFAEEVGAEDSAAIQLGTDALSVLSKNVNTATAPTVYFGQNHENNPAAWRVIGYDGSGVTSSQGDITLLAAGAMGVIPFADTILNNEYAPSNLKATIDALAEKLTTEENAAVKKRALTSGSYDGENTDCVAGGQVDNAVFWPLSAKEAIVVNNDLRALNPAHPNWVTTAWWLRSPGSNKYNVAVVRSDGSVEYSGYTMLIFNNHRTVRPAFNLNLNSVLFASAAVGGKPDGGLTEVSKYSGNEWKLTLLDSRRNFAVTEKTVSAAPDDTVTLNYKGATTGKNEYISVILADNNGAQYYGRVAQPTAESGTVEIKIPSDIAPGDYTMKVFSEQYNGDCKTDLASAFADVTLTVESQPDEQFTLTPGGRYYFDLSAMNIPGTVNSNLPDSTLHYVPFTYAGTVNAYKLTSEMATTEEYAQKNKYPHSLFIADYVVTHTVSWDDLNTKSLIFGKDYASGGVDYTLRAPSVGSNFIGLGNSERGVPQSNEWDTMLNKNSGYIQNWNKMYSWGQDTSSAAESFRAYRGYNSARFWYYTSSSFRNVYLGFRPVLEVLNPGTLGSDGLKAVTLNLGGGKLGGSSDAIHIIVKNGRAFTAPASDGLTRPDGNTGSYFMWLDGNGKSYEPGDSVPADVTELTVQWTAPTYTVTLHANGGTINNGNVTEYTYGVGATLPTADDMTYTGYTFKGWYDNENLTGSPVTAISNTETGNKEYWAKWEINQYTITVKPENGKADITITQDYGTPITSPADPIREGYTFIGWDREIPKTVPAENITVTAQWEINQYTIAFDTAGGSEIAPITQDYGTNITAPADPTREGYTFIGWDREIPKTMPAENITVTAQWEINRYTITFDTAGGSEIAPITQDYGTNITAPANPTRKGYTFKGWDKEIPETMPAENITVKAQWEINRYTITFDTAGGSEIAPITQDYGTNITAPANPTRKGYTFKGWDKEIPETMPAENITVKAQWEINQYTIAFDTNGGSEIATITQDYGTEITAPDNPTREGYTFIGWDRDIPVTMPAENITLKARWKDSEKPTGEIKINENSWKAFLNNITFGLFFKDTQTVTINAADNSGETVTVEYLLSDKELTKAEFDGMTFTAYTAPFGIDPDNEYIIYVRLTDNAGNTDYICSDGIVLDGTSPVITGIEDGKTYCEAQTVTITEKYVDTVTVNGTAVTLDATGSFTLAPADGEQRIVVTDKAGNETRVIVTVNDGHTYEWQSENGQYWQKCKFCNHETAKKDIPTINISGADKVCRMQDYKFSFTLPEGATDAAYGYEFIGLGDGPLTPTFEGGMYCGVIKSAAYPAEETSFKLIVSAKTADGFEFSAEKTVAIQNEHSGGTATCTEQATCEICGEKYGDLKPHSYSVKWSTGEASHWHECTECRAKTDEAEHTDTNKDHKCDVCDKVLSECTDTNKDHKCDLCGKALSEHSGGKATCKDKAKCEFCGESYGELNANNHSDLKHFPAVAATKTAEGNIEYWYCEGCGKYYSDKDGTKEIKKADTVTAKLKDDSKSPQTGDTSNLALWIALLFVSGGAAIGTTVVSRKKKYNR